jgi:hypothetical protein
VKFAASVATLGAFDRFLRSPTRRRCARACATTSFGTKWLNASAQSRALLVGDQNFQANASSVSELGKATAAQQRPASTTPRQRNSQERRSRGSRRAAARTTTIRRRGYRVRRADDERQETPQKVKRQPIADSGKLAQGPIVEQDSEKAVAAISTTSSVGPVAAAKIRREMSRSAPGAGLAIPDEHDLCRRNAGYCRGGRGQTSS